MMRLTMQHEWQPIETAPRVGNVLTYGPDGYAVAWSMDGKVWTAGDSDDDWFCVEPTHWMPLPDRPDET